MQKNPYRSNIMLKQTTHICVENVTNEYAVGNNQELVCCCLSVILNYITITQTNAKRTGNFCELKPNFLVLSSFGIHIYLNILSIYVLLMCLSTRYFIINKELHR